MEGNILDTPFQFIAHQVNCQGVMGAGLARQIKMKYPEVFQDYVKYCKLFSKDNLFGSGFGSWTRDNKHCILNIFGQFGYGIGKRQTDYDALYAGFAYVIKLIRDTYFVTNKSYQIVIAIPYGIGCGLAGGDWNEVKSVLEAIEKECNVVFIAYTLGGQ